MKATRICLSLLLISGIMPFLSTCRKESDEIKKISKAKVSGYVQKGPFVNGTSVQMYELNASLDQTGKVFNTQIINNKGSFEINDVELSSQFVQFSANGYYYNEISGEVSVSTLNLYALADISDISTVNVNILTHLEKGRVEYLLDSGKNFAEAKSTAQSEVLGIFGYQLNNMDRSEMLDISVNKMENAILIAMSVILQGNRSVGDLTELLANINTDIRQDGQLNDNNVMTSLINSVSDLDMPAVRTNLQNRYDQLGLSVTIPGFEQYICDFLAIKGSKPTVSDIAVTDIAAKYATLTGTVNANGLKTSVTFEYGTTMDYGQTIDADQNPVTGSLNTSVSVYLNNLNMTTLYHFRIKAENILGTSYSEDLTFTTWGAPSVETGDYLYPSSDGALVTADVNPHGPVYVTFEYGTTTAYGNETEPLPPFTHGDVLENVSIIFRFSGLAPDTEYHYRIKAEAMNDPGIFEPSLGEDKSFRTLNTLTDIEGNIYKLVQLPDGIWMAENLKTAKYNDGTYIPNVTNGITWSTVTTPAYCWYNNDGANYKATYGALYNWYAVNTGKLCPTGWHVPTDAEWTTLSKYYGGSGIAGGPLKENGTTHWQTPNTGATNISGFTALPAGGRKIDGDFLPIGPVGRWWSSTEGNSTAAWSYIMHSYLPDLERYNHDKKRGHSIRCIKDN